MTDTVGTEAPASTEAPATPFDAQNFFENFFEKTEGTSERKKKEPEADDADETEEEPEGDQPEGDDEGTDAEEAEGTDEDTEDEEEPTDEGDGQQPEMIPVKIDGKVEQVTLEELKKGYSRTKVFTQKTQEAAEMRKQAEADRAAAQAEREALVKAIEAVNAQLAELDPEPDWDALRENPEDYAYQHALWAQKKDKRDRMEAVKQEMARRTAAERDAALRETVKREHDALLEKIPAWKDEKVRVKEADEIRAYALSLGFPEEAMNAVYDHRLVLLLRNASRYERLMADKDALPKKKGDATKIEKRTPKTLTPGSGDAKGKARTAERRANAMDQLRKSGSQADAAEVFKLLPGFLD